MSVEMMTRVGVWLVVGALVGREDDSTQFDQARQVVDDGHGREGVVTRPELLRGIEGHVSIYACHWRVRKHRPRCWGTEKLPPSS